jgi:hypothetical protein
MARTSHTARKTTGGRAPRKVVVRRDVPAASPNAGSAEIVRPAPAHQVSTLDSFVLLINCSSDNCRSSVISALTVAISGRAIDAAVSSARCISLCLLMGGWMAHVLYVLHAICRCFPYPLRIL